MGFVRLCYASANAVGFGGFVMGRRGRAPSGAPLEPTFAEALADTMFALSAPSRIQILYLLLERPHDVSELVAALGMGQSAVSHQLRVLRDHSLVRVDREGSRRVYALADQHVVALLEQAAGHVDARSKQHRLLTRVRAGQSR